MTNFPGSLDNDASLYVAKDYIQTTLAAPQAIGDSVAVVTSPAGWAVDMVLTVDVGKTSVEQQLVTGVVGNVLTVTRAFGGTSASAHAQGAAVANNVDAAYFTALKNAIVAVETALGANLSKIATLPAFSSTQYNFAAQTPGGALGIGANTITFPNGIPAGISADSINVAFLYISGGVGTAEAVPIIGVNVGLNQVTVTCANTHSGAWTIQSATGGCQEAIIATAGSGRVLAAAGAINLFAGITVPGAYSCSLRGAGFGVTQFRTHGTTGDWIYFPKGSGYVDVGDFTIIDNSGTFHSSGSMVRVSYKLYGAISNIEVENSFWGITSEANQGVQPFNCTVGTTKYGIYITTLGVANAGGVQSAGIVMNCVASLVGTGGAAFQVEGTTVGVQLVGCLGSTVTAAAQTRSLQFLVNSAVGPLNEISVIGGIYDAGGLGIGIIGDGVTYSNNFITFTGVECNGFEYGFYADAKVGNIKWTGGYIKCAGGAAQQGLFLRNVQSTHFSDVDIDCPGPAISADTVTDIVLDGVRLGRNGTVPSSGLTFANAITRFTVQNSDFLVIATAANRIVNPAQAGAQLTLVNNAGLGSTTGVNYIGAETGINNALVVTLPGVPLAAGLQMRVLLAHTLQIGANTIAVNGTVLNLKSSRNTANNVAIGYAVGGTIGLIYDGTQLQDVSQ